MRLRRKQLGLSQTELGRQAKLHRNAISNIEREIHMPRWPTACRLARVLACDPLALFPYNSEAGATNPGSAERLVDDTDRPRPEPA